MQKVFALLLAELRKLGATIIFANFSKVIIDTGKFELTAAKAYCDSVLKTLQNRFVMPTIIRYIFRFLFLLVILLSLLNCRELFEWIELEPLQFWHSLLFMDQVCKDTDCYQS
jgi:DNA polymerase epsilon subunit 1